MQKSLRGRSCVQDLLQSSISDEEVIKKKCRSRLRNEAHHDNVKVLAVFKAALDSGCPRAVTEGLAESLLLVHSGGRLVGQALLQWVFRNTPSQRTLC